jgi:hypothetical protein
MEHVDVPACIIDSGNYNLLINFLNSAVPLARQMGGTEQPICLRSDDELLTSFRTDVVSEIWTEFRRSDILNSSWADIEWAQKCNEALSLVAVELSKCLGCESHQSGSVSDASHRDIREQPTLDEMSTRSTEHNTKVLSLTSRFPLYKTSIINKVRTSATLFELTLDVYNQGKGGGIVHCCDRQICAPGNSLSVNGKVLADLRRIVKHRSLDSSVDVNTKMRLISCKNEEAIVCMLEILVEYMQENSHSRRKKHGEMVKKNTMPTQETDGRRKENNKKAIEF